MTRSLRVGTFRAHYPFVPIPFGIRDDHAPPSSTPGTAAACRLRPSRGTPGRHRPLARWQPCCRRSQRDGLCPAFLDRPSCRSSSPRSPGPASDGSVP
jgi:hypothetical protein